MPQLGESVHEGTISHWLVEPGDGVVAYEPMLEVETDKVTAEVPSPVTGIVKQILAQDGETVPSGGEIAVVEVETLHPDASAGLPLSSSPQPETSATTAKAPAVERSSGTELRSESVEYRSSPAVRTLAKEYNIDLEFVKGTGLGGRVSKKDVESAAAGRGAVDEPPPAPVTPPAQLALRPGDQRVPLSRVRRLIAENMVKSKSTIPHAWQTQEVDMSGVVANRSANKGRFSEEEGFSLTFLPYVVKAAAVSLREHPRINATFAEDSILIHGDVSIGIAVGTEDAVVVPVIRRTDQLSIAEIARAVNDLTYRVRNGKLMSDDLQGGTFTVNNSGTFGTLLSYSVITPGQAGILTMGAIIERPVAEDGILKVKPMMYLSFSLDHRMIDGLRAARFLGTCKRWLETVTPATSLSR